MKNAVHSSSSATKAAEVIREFFPEVMLNQDGTVKGSLSLHFSVFFSRSILLCSSLPCQFVIVVYINQTSPNLYEGENNSFLIRIVHCSLLKKDLKEINGEPI